MRRTMVGALWGMILYLVGHAIVGLIVGGPAVDAWRPLIALVAAALAATGAGKGGCRARRTRRIQTRVDNPIRDLLSSTLRGAL